MSRYFAGLAAKIQPVAIGLGGTARGLEADAQTLAEVDAAPTAAASAMRPEGAATSTRRDVMADDREIAAASVAARRSTEPEPLAIAARQPAGLPPQHGETSAPAEPLQPSPAAAAPAPPEPPAVAVSLPTRVEAVPMQRADVAATQPLPRQPPAAAPVAAVAAPVGEIRAEASARVAPTVPPRATPGVLVPGTAMPTRRPARDRGEAPRDGSGLPRIDVHIGSVTLAVRAAVPPLPQPAAAAPSPAAPASRADVRPSFSAHRHYLRAG